MTCHPERSEGSAFLRARRRSSLLVLQRPRSPACVGWRIGGQRSQRPVCLASSWPPTSLRRRNLRDATTTHELEEWSPRAVILRPRSSGAEESPQLLFRPELLSAFDRDANAFPSPRSCCGFQNIVTTAFVAALYERRKDGGRRPPLQQWSSLYSAILNRSLSHAFLIPSTRKRTQRLSTKSSREQWGPARPRNSRPFCGCSVNCPTLMPSS